MVWGISSSSGSDSDEDRPVSKLRTDTPFYRAFQNGNYGPEWPPDILAYSKNQRELNARNALNSTLLDTSAMNSTLLNGSFGNINNVSVANKSVLGTTSDEVVLVREGEKLRVMRVVNVEDLLPPRTSPETKANPRHHSKVSKKSHLNCN